MARAKSRPAEPERETHPDFMLSLARGLAVLRAFGRSRKGLSNAELSRATGLARATVRRCLHTLEQLGYVASEDDGRYRVTAQVMALGATFLDATPFVAAAQPVLDRVRDALGESCSLGVLTGTDVLYLARSESARIMSVGLRVGSRLPAFCTSMGRVLLAALDDAALQNYFAVSVREKFTERTITEAPALKRLLEQARKNGFATVDQELEHGLRSLSVPVRNSEGVVIAALNIGAPATRLSLRDMETRCLSVLKKAAAELEKAAAL